MLILDADSLMTGDTIVRLVAAMDNHRKVALIQTLPIAVNARTLFARWQQFAGRPYGPLIAAGIAWWHGSEGNYWGHNAIIRVRAFARYAALPELKGRKPFGGHILSHDFIEAAFMRRGGWAIHMAPTLGGSYEESAFAAGFCRPRQVMVSGQSTTSSDPSGARPSLGLAAPSSPRNWILSHGTALVRFFGARNSGIAAGAVCQARVFSKGIFAISDLARAGSHPGSMGIRCHDGNADPAQAARLHHRANS
jgi:hypothetical protein